MTSRKHFGQNFLINQSAIFDIIKAFDPYPTQHIVEIGPGLGALTYPLIDHGAKIDAIEIDRNLVFKFNKISNKNFTIHNKDILKFDLHKLSPKPLRIIGNLPYNISTPLLFKMFKHLNIISDMLFMLQHEIAQRLTARPNSKAYGKLSIITQYYCDMEIIMDLTPQAFKPQPKVFSNIVRFKPKIKLPNCDINILKKLLHSAFNQRRKIISNSLRNLLTNEDLLKLNLNPNLRTENISIDDYIRIANYLGNK